MKPLSILIPDGDSPFAPHVLACLAHNHDFQIHLISQRPYPLTRFSRWVSFFHVRHNGQPLLETLQDLCKKYPIDLCLPVDTEGIYHLAENRAHYEKLMPPALIDSAFNLRRVWDKALLANFLVAENLPHPPTATKPEALSQVTFPTLIKPRLAGGGVGIQKIAKPEDLQAMLEKNPIFFETDLVQECFAGEDIDCSVWCQNGQIVAHTIQKGLYPAENFQAPDVIEFVRDDEVLNLAAQLMAALHWNGIAHIDMRRRASDGKLLIIEINPRFWGSLEGSLHAGVNFPSVAIYTSLGYTAPSTHLRAVRYASAAAALKRKIKGKPTVNLWHETNLKNHLKDPLPILARLAGFE